MSKTPTDESPVLPLAQDLANCFEFCGEVHFWMHEHDEEYHIHIFPEITLIKGEPCVPSFSFDIWHAIELFDVDGVLYQGDEIVMSGTYKGLNVLVRAGAPPEDAEATSVLHSDGSIAPIPEPPSPTVN